MKYGVITACLNSASTIQLTIDSVLNQSILPVEYIFVDGGSADDTLAIINKKINHCRAKSLDIDFTLINQQTGGGIYEAWNMALQIIQSDLVFILSSDDWYLPDTAKNVFSLFNDNPDAEIVLGSGYYGNSPQDTNPLICHNRPFSVLPFAMPIIHPACFVKKKVYDKIGLFDLRYKVSADYDFIYRCIKANVPIKICNDIFVNVLLGGFSAKNKNIARKETFEIARRHCNIPFLPMLAFMFRRLLNK